MFFLFVGKRSFDDFAFTAIQHAGVAAMPIPSSWSGMTFLIPIL